MARLTHRVRCPGCGDEFPILVDLVQPVAAADGRQPSRPAKQATVGAPLTPDSSAQLAMFVQRINPPRRETSARFYEVYRVLAQQLGWEPVSMTLFVKQLRRMGLKAWRSNSERGLEVPADYALPEKYRTLIERHLRRVAAAEERAAREAAEEQPVDEEELELQRIRREYGSVSD